MNSREVEFKDEIITKTRIIVSFMDRIRILLGKTIHLSVSTKTENLPGKVQSKSTVWVDRIIKQKTCGGYEEIKEKKQ